MSKLLKEIKAGIGLVNLKFGISREDVKNILGEPDEIEVYDEAEEDESNTESWHYDELELSLRFDDDEDWRLTTLSITSEAYTYEGKTLIGMEKEELLAHLSELKIDDLEFEDWGTDEDPGHELVISESTGINFWFDGPVLTEVQWNPLFIDDDTLDWPA